MDSLLKPNNPFNCFKTFNVSLCIVKKMFLANFFHFHSISYLKVAKLLHLIETAASIKYLTFRGAASIGENLKH